jgi:hypothetical protein
MTVFVLTIFFFMSLIMFTLLFNMSTIFVDKEVASNSAQQASIAATEVVYDEMKEAIRLYDLSITHLYNPVYISPQVNEEEAYLRSAHPEWSDSEVRFNAIDRVLDRNIPGNGELYSYVNLGLVQAQSKIPEIVGEILEDNGAVRSGSVVTFLTSDLRIEVETSVRYQSETFGLEFLDTHTDEVTQTAQSRRIAFAEVMGFLRNRITL